ncbi:uncharacterized protein GGS22DRAFT_26345 [Annulohypoxylon maeteangense]|uniref:uncharacterized protein n=1 Tax=Annulohypoxylon maeteangense TaxID=1927788 RepID=UPI0020083A2F|nr:uncharacterized protein GGS22DRAFT_26345 [Annulohypoxylon maeteangense]KAI0883818.1 hypothetical protein GGS22DRAFT_26345 [Annulohypoxylon maeteangense]
MADEDFEIDVYGDAPDANDAGDSANADAATLDESKPDESNNHAYENNSSITIANGSNPDSMAHSHHDGQEEQNDMHLYSERATPSQSLKRKEVSDDRPIDPGATSALLLSELQWWSTDDDVRGWIRRASCEDELKDITFSEHKVNGKSKGQAYVEFTSQQAATAAKRQIENVASELTHGGKKITITYTSHTTNPFKTLPKDAPARANKDGGSRGGSSMGGYNDRGGFRGRGGGFNGPRGGFRGNYQGNMGGGFHGNNPGGFNSNMGGGNFGGGGFGNMGGGGGGGPGFNFRGGGMMPGGGGMRGGGMRGGRGGGMNPAMNPGMMGGMGPMGMPMMGFQQPAHFNPAFFGGNQQSDWQNPHGAKRPREN